LKDQLPLHTSQYLPYTNLLHPATGPANRNIDEVHDGRRFAGDVGDWRLDEPERQAGGRRALGDRAAHRGDRCSMVGADVDDELVRADRVGGQESTIEDQVGTGSHDGPILAAMRFALGAVGDDHGRAGSPLGDGSPLGADRETRPATPEQTASLERPDQVGTDARHGPEADVVSGKALAAGCRRRPGKQPIGGLEDRTHETALRAGRAASILARATRVAAIRQARQATINPKKARVSQAFSGQKV